jgi:sugar (pentulose or hexulose) kinase
MAGERTPLWNSDARGVFFGLSYKTSRADMIRALMEGCAFAVRDNLAIAETKGAVVTQYLASGGATQSAVWCQIKADIYGKPLIVARRADGGEGGHTLGLYALRLTPSGRWMTLVGVSNAYCPTVKSMNHPPSVTPSTKIYSACIGTYPVNCSQILSISPPLTVNITLNEVSDESSHTRK